MELQEFKAELTDLIKLQQEKVDKIHSTNLGAANLFSEYRLLKDLELLKEELGSDQIRAGMLISSMCLRNPGIAAIFSPFT